MRRSALLIGLILLLTACASMRVARIEPGSDHELLVTVRYSKTDTLPSDPSERYIRPAPYGGGLGAEPLLNALARDYAIRRVVGWPMRSLGVHCEVFAATKDVEAIASRMARDPRIDSATPLHEYRTLTGTDAYRPLQHALDTLEIDRAHTLSQGAGTRVAIIDTGIDAAHRDLAGAVREQHDFSDAPQAPHGTEVAGVIAARAVNGSGIAGVAPAAALVDLRACAGSADPAQPASCNSFALARALDFAVTDKVDVINLSLAGPDDALLARLLAAAEARGIAVVAAAPPPNDRSARFPASVPSVVSVAMLEDRAQWPGATTRAPGVDVLTTFPGNRYDYASGSSLASAHVSGVVALMRALDRNLAPAQIRALLSSHKQLSAASVLSEEAARFSRR